MLANYSVTYSAIDTQGINYFYTKILHLAFLHCAGPETDHVTYLDPPLLLTRGLGGAYCSRLDDSGVRNVVRMDG